jgi:predicted transcriptional regulator of viral defense system
MISHGIVVRMPARIDWESLGRLAEDQAGYFTAAQAAAIGAHRNTLAHHARRGGRLERSGRGLYRLRFFPSSPFEHIAAAWVAAGPDEATVSHKSALELYDLSDVIADQVHLTLPRERRHRRAPVGVRFHFPHAPVGDDERRRVHGLRATAVERTLLDVLQDGETQPEQIDMAIEQSLARGLTTPRRLHAAAEHRPATVRRSLERRLGGR